MYLAGSAWSHLKPNKPFLSRADWVRIGGGIILAAIVGAILARHWSGATVLVNVGSFFGALIALLPRHHSRTASVVAGVLIIDGGALRLRARPQLTALPPGQ